MGHAGFPVGLVVFLSGGLGEGGGESGGRVSAGVEFIQDMLDLVNDNELHVAVGEEDVAASKLVVGRILESYYAGGRRFRSECGTDVDIRASARSADGGDAGGCLVIAAGAHESEQPERLAYCSEFLQVGREETLVILSIKQNALANHLEVAGALI